MFLSMPDECTIANGICIWCVLIGRGFKKLRPVIGRAFKEIEGEDFSWGIEGRRRIRLSRIDFNSQ
jgi:hypothetical protein